MSSLVGWIVNSFIFGIFTIIIYFRLQKLDGKLAVVLVFGDLGHSPRTISHARSLLRNGYKVHLVGYHISELSQDIVGNEKCTVHKLPVPTLLGKRGIVLFLFYGVARFISQCFGMLLLFLTIPRPGLLLVQNPPAVPTLLIAQVYTILCGTRLVIDWHNFGFSIIKLQKGGLASIPFKIYEKLFGIIADTHITVTEAMRLELKSWPVFGTIITFYDRPSHHFKSIGIEDKIEFLHHLDLTETNIRVAADYCESELVENSKLKNHRPLLVVSSTSWTPDEDFHVLFSGLQKYDQSDTALPPLFVVITGKGPLKSYYEQEFIKLNLSRVKLFFAWLDFGDYAKLLACADFGVSLHTSSSGLDLPMKIVDMMGAGIPVFAYEFNCIREIIKHGQNGFVFNDGETLATLIVDFVQKSDRDLMFRQELSKFQEIGWDASWDKILLPRLGKQD